MDLARLGIDVRGQGSDVRRDQFLEFAVVEYIAADRGNGLERTQHFLGGRIVAVASAFRFLVELQLPEEKIAYLLGGVDVD